MKKANQRIETAITDSQVFMDKLQSDGRGFEKLSLLLKTLAGINMTTNDKNLTLMASRLAPVLKKHDLSGYADYQKLLSERSPAHVSEFISALTTNTTQFFREPVHFDVLKEKLRDMMELKKKQHNYELRVWCSAASTGQEPYTILMTVLSQIQNLNHWNVRFLATDIDPEVLERAADGTYQESEMQGVPDILRQQYFHCVGSVSPKRYRVKPEIRNLIRFASFNLLTEKYPFQHPFDIIFCRNVLIYFDRPTAEGVVEKLARALRPGGYLFLGHSETGMMKSKSMKNVSSAAYQKIGG